MGSCLGRCLTSKKNKCHGVENSIYFNTESIEFDCLVGKAETSGKKRCKFRGITSFLSLRQKKRNGEEASLELDEDDWPRSDLRSKRSQVCTTKMDGNGIKSLNACPLNVYALEELQDVTSPSSRQSSIDLEWEPEGLILPEVPASVAVSEEKENIDCALSGIGTSSLSATPWSRMSSPNSLEWDPCEEEQGVVGGSGEIYGEDAETEQLISEIEQLTSQALRETGTGWSGCLR